MYIFKSPFSFYHDIYNAIDRSFPCISFLCVCVHIKIDLFNHTRILSGICVTLAKSTHMLKYYQNKLLYLKILFLFYFISLLLPTTTSFFFFFLFYFNFFPIYSLNKINKNDCVAFVYIYLFLNKIIAFQCVYSSLLLHSRMQVLL